MGDEVTQKFTGPEGDEGNPASKTVSNLPVRATNYILEEEK